VSVLRARIVEVGFLVPPEPPRPEWTTGDVTWRLLRIPGIEPWADTQYFRVSLDDREVFVVNASHPVRSDADCTAIAAVLSAHLVDVVLVFLRASGDGWERATCATGATPELAAPAAATVQRLATLNETNPIAVAVDGQAFEVDMVRSERQWFARVQHRLHDPRKNS